MRMPNITRRMAAFSLTSACTLLLLTGCGGGAPMNSLAQPAGGSQDTQTARATPVTTKAHTYSSLDASSFTLNSTAQFDGFNPDLWNRQKSWDECDCGRTSQPQPKTMPWNTAG